MNFSYMEQWEDRPRSPRPHLENYASNIFGLCKTRSKPETQCPREHAAARLSPAPRSFVRGVVGADDRIPACRRSQGRTNNPYCRAPLPGRESRETL